MSQSLGHSHDEINKLLSPKALVNFEKWDEEAVKRGSPKSVSVNDITEEDNLLIKGNNLLALHCLKRKYAEKIKLIYIDPPYNTGNDFFKYNDNFNHSSWLTFMKNRLEIARELLRDDTNWESTITKILNCNPENILLEYAEFCSLSTEKWEGKPFD